MVQWDRQRQRVYFGPGRRYRLHHGSAGAALVLLGAALAFHDRHDWPWPFVDRE